MQSAYCAMKPLENVAHSDRNCVNEWKNRRITGGLHQATRLYASDDCEYLLADKAYDSGEFRFF